MSSPFRITLSRTAAASVCGVALAGHMAGASEVAPPVHPHSEHHFRGAHTFWSRGNLTGNWLGIRDQLSEQGVEFSFGYTAEAMGNVSGGLKRGVNYQGLAELGADIDLEKLSGWWRGGSFHVGSFWIHGDSPMEELVGDLLGVSNIDAFDTIRLYELWLQQNFLNDRVSLRFGNLVADEEFALTEYGSLFFNGAFGWPAFISANTLNSGPAYAVAAPGVRLRVVPVDQWFIQAAVFDGDPLDDPAGGDPRKNASGTRVHFNDEQATFSIYETGYRLNQAGGDTGLPGTYRVGGWLHTGKFADNFKDTAGGSFIVSGLPPRMHRNNYGVYFGAEQMVWRERNGDGLSAQGLGVFFRVGGSPGDRSALDLVVDGGLHYLGLIPGRDDDAVGVGVIYASVSNDIRRQQRDDRDINGTPIPALADHELVLEATYQIAVTPWLTVQPNFQWIHHPGGSSALRDAFVFGARANFSF